MYLKRFESSHTQKSKKCKDCMNLQMHETPFSDI